LLCKVLYRQLRRYRKPSLITHPPATLDRRIAPPHPIGGNNMPTVTQLNVNGGTRAVSADPDRTLLSVLRDDLGLTGSKYGCGEGKCGACTVHLDGHRAHSCVTRVAAADGKQIRTIEGLAAGDRLHPLQQAFLDVGALQCGYCTPGMIMAAAALLEEQRDPSREDIIRALNGNICRCGTYGRIIEAVERAAKAMKGGGK
jgi:aerobic-type carbon monoxide dehydrogenase small subunit (CoxS/CutS family)